MSKNRLNEITAIIVLYNSEDIIFRCLENLKNIKIIIADNGKNNSEKIRKIKLNKNIIKYFKFKKNIGFGRACNFCQKYVETEYTLLIEPDVIINEKNILRLLEGFTKYPNSGVTIPTIINEKYEVIDKLKNLPEQLSLSKIDETKINHFFHGDVCLNFDLAAIMMFKNSIIKINGLFNKKIFIYWEDYFLCRLYRKRKVPIMKIFDAQAIHFHGASTKKTFLSKFILEKHYMKSFLIYSHSPKNSIFLKKRSLLYLFRAFTYLLIFNLNNSFKNFAKFCASIEYMKIND